jgi:hypothetical protein
MRPSTANVEGCSACLSKGLLCGFPRLSQIEMVMPVGQVEKFCWEQIVKFLRRLDRDVARQFHIAAKRNELLPSGAPGRLARSPCGNLQRPFPKPILGGLVEKLPYHRNAGSEGEFSRGMAQGRDYLWSIFGVVKPGSLS